MNRIFLTCAIAAFGTLTGVVQAMQAPPSQQQPQADEATTRMVWQGVDSAFPEIMSGPEKPGTFIVMIGLRPDGSVVHSNMHYAETRAQGAPFLQEMRDQLPGEGKAIPVSSNNRKGAAVLGDRTLKGDVYINAIMVAANFDATRDRGIIRRVVLQEHRDLFLPVSGDHINQLVVVMNEKGGIAARWVEEVSIEHQGERIMFRQSRVSATDFAALGLKPDQVGLMGDMTLQLPAAAPQPAGATAPEQPQLKVRFAWPRRAGEPAGVDPQAQPSISQNGKPSEQIMKIMNVIEQHFPAASNRADGDWILLDSRGDFVRKGHAEVTKDEPMISRLTNGYLERQFPGIKVAQMTGISVSPPPQKPGDAPGRQVTVIVYMLAEGSPLPPAESPATGR